ncbi:hypothetical protein GCM10018790_12350 [Kitasatospora xanthocidica]|uniref:DUF4232 domain-containing protein n=1 Tax=Kitasatospora xanthocidica TaxID=83382 RepID=UPI0019A94BE5|nr:DUF4232 domain-containing protein [Kitasatospora xanthocidica]GHF35900.1 hypothetical protein GCM10018790_12350 [Kitasatospora xanthocidica]
MSVRRAFFVPVVLALGAALSLTACQSGDAAGGAPQSAPPTRAASAPGSAAPAVPAADPAGAAPAPAAPAAPAANGTPAPPKAPAATSAATPAPAGGGDAGGGEAYAYSHPCEAKKLSVRVTTRAEAPGQRVIEVRNQGTTACGLSYYPLLSLGDSHAADRGKDVRPLVPGGLGGAPAYPVAAGQPAYAVLDLNPGGTAGGAAAGVDELNVLADGDHMAAADARSFPLGSGAKVGKPRLGLYRSTVADAAASAAGADRQS